MDLLKYLLQCVEEELQKESEASIFSVFLVLRVAFSVYLQPKRRPHTVKVTKQELRHPTILPLSVSMAQELSASLQNQEETTSTSSETSPQKQPSPKAVKTPTSSLSPKQKSPPAHSSGDTNILTRRALKFEEGSDSVLATPVPAGSQENSTTPIPSIREGAISSSEERTNRFASNRSPPLTFESGSTEHASRDPQHMTPVAIGNGKHEKQGSDDTVLVTPKTFDSSITTSKDTPQNQQFYTPSSEFSDTDSKVPIPSPHWLKHMKSTPVKSRSPRLLEAFLNQDPKKATFVYKDLMKALGNSRTFMLSRQFWNVLFMSTIDTDRNYMGWNEKTAELYER